MSKSRLLLNVLSNLQSLADSLQAIAEAIEGNEPFYTSEPETLDSVEVEKSQAKPVTLEEVRAVLAEKSHDGFTTEVRTLLEKHGAPRLSEIDPAKYAALLADAKELK